MRHKKVNKRKVLLIVLGCVAALAVGWRETPALP